MSSKCVENIVRAGALSQQNMKLQGDRKTFEEFQRIIVKFMDSRKVNYIIRNTYATILKRKVELGIEKSH